MNKYGTAAIPDSGWDAGPLALVVEAQAVLARSLAELIAAVKELSDRFDRLEGRVEAGALAVEVSEQASSEARRGEEEAGSERNSKDGKHAASAAAHVEPVPLTRTATDAGLTVGRESGGAPAPCAALSEARKLAELMHSLEVKPPPFRIQFLGLASVGGSRVLKEVDLEASTSPPQSSPPRTPIGRHERSRCASSTARIAKSLSGIAERR